MFCLDIKKFFALLLTLTLGLGSIAAMEPMQEEQCSSLHTRSHRVRKRLARDAELPDQEKFKAPVEVDENRENASVSSSEQKTTDFSIFTNLFHFCSQELPEHESGTPNGDQPYYINHVQAFFGYCFENFIDLLIKFAKTYQGRPEYYMESAVIPAQSKIIVMGDIHASLHALLRNLHRLYEQGLLHNDYTLAPNTYLVFLGDYADRGYYGLETFYTLAKLRIANPEKVFLLRGNHEDRSAARAFGLSNECLQKGCILGLCAIVANFFNKLPSTIFLGTHNNESPIKWIQFVHGSVVVPQVCGAKLEAMSNLMMPAQDQLVNIQAFLNSQNNIKEISLAEHIQYSWGEIDQGANIALSIRGEGLSIGIDLLNTYLQHNNISKICRGHTHVPGGILIFEGANWRAVNSNNPADLAQNIFMFMNCPEGLGYVGINQDAYGIWTFNGGEWQLEPHVCNKEHNGQRRISSRNSSRNSYRPSILKQN